MALVDIASNITILPVVGRAIYAGNDQLFSITENSLEPVPFYFESYSAGLPHDLLGFEVSSRDLNETQEILKLEKDSSDALFFFLASLDLTLTRTVREESASMVEELLSDADVYYRVELALLSEPYHSTKEAPLENSFSTFHKYSDLIKKAQSHQQAARLFWSAWSSMKSDTDALSLPFDLDTLRDLMLSSGSVKSCIQALNAGNRGAFNTAILDLTLQPDVKVRFARAASLLTELRNTLERARAFFRKPTDLRSVPLSAAQENAEDEYGNGWNQGEKQFVSHEIYQSITKQIASIRPLLYSGARALVERSVHELIAFQKLHSQPDYLAKTLCNLAAIARDADEMEIAKDLSDEATRLGLHDPVVDGTAADVMKNLGRFDAARTLYEEAIAKFGQERYLINGLADVLKELGQYEEALAIYRQAESKYPDDPVAPNGIATVYFAMGNPLQALAKATKNVKFFGDLVSRIVCGNVLRHLGRNHESLAMMRETIETFPRELGAWNGYIRSLSLVGRRSEALLKCDELIALVPEKPLPRLMRADLLRKMGKLSESLASFNSALVKFPAHRGLQLGKASVLLLLNQPHEAAQIAEVSNPESEMEWRMFHVYAASFIRLGKFQEALALLEKGQSIVPWKNLRSLFSDTAGYVIWRLGNPKKAIERFRLGLRTADKVKRNGLFLLISNAYAELGRYDDSARYRNDVVTDDPVVKEFKNASASGLYLVKRSGPTAEKIEQNELQMLLATA